MNYSLGNMLNGGESLNADGLSLDLQFATDKTLVARKGPTPTFTRASGATQIGATGLIEYAPENLILQSQNFANASWNKTSGATVGSAVTDPFGGNDAYTLNFTSTNTSAVGQSNSVLQAGQSATISVWLRADANDIIFLRFAFAGEVAFTANVTPVWQRFTYTATGGGTFPQITSGSIGPKTIYAYGFQVERHPSARTYIPTTTAAVFGARFDHDPVTLASKGLLIEESRTNLVIQSQAPATSPWADTSNGVGTGTATATNNTVVSPDGTTNGATLALSGRSASVRIQQISQNQTVSAILYNSSVWVKATTAGDVGKVVNLWQGNGATAINIVSITLTSTWTRVSTTGSTNQIAGSRELMVIGRLSTGLGGPADLTAVSVDIWGMQTEAGAFPTSYIPTTTASVVRSTDVCTITGTDFNTVYNQPEHSLFAEASAMSHAGFGSYLSFDNGTTAEQSTLAGFPSPNSINCYEVDNSTTQAQATKAITLNQNNKMAAGMKLNSFQVALNNTLGTEDTSGTMATANILRIGKNSSGTTISGTYAQIKVFKKRLPNAKLASLTA